MQPSITRMALDALGQDWLNDYGWALLIVIFLFVLSLYIWSYLSKSFEKMRTKEGKYIDEDVVNFLSWMARIIIIMVLTLSLIYVLSRIWDEFGANVWEPSLVYISDLIAIVAILLTAMLVVQILRRIARAERMTNKEDRGMKSTTVEITSLLLSYVIYIIAFFTTVLIILSIFSVDPIGAIGDFLASKAGNILTLFVLIIAIFFIMKVLEAVLDDFKFRTKKFNPQVIDLFKSVLGYILWTIVLLTIVYNLFTLFGMSDIGVILVALITVFICVTVALSYSTVKNIFAGLAIMDSSPFDVGDRVDVDNGLECEVISKNLLFTQVRTLDGDFVDVPNSRIIQGTIINYSRSIIHTVSIRMEVDFGMPHDEVRSLVLKASAKVDGILKEPEAQLYAVQLEGNRILYEVRVSIKDALKAKEVKSNLIFAVQDGFHENGRKILFN